MRTRVVVLAVGLGAVLAAWWWSRTRVGAAFVEDLVVSVAGAWSPPKTAAPYLPAIAAAEQRNGLPPLLLARVAHQESRFREDIITGKVMSSAGALGLMQIVPRWHPGVDVLDPFASIDYAANYLRQLHRQFGDWKLALAAYNWGPGNLSEWLKASNLGHASSWPTETANYVDQISKDVLA